MQCCGSGILCLFYPWIRDPGWVKNQDPDAGSRTGMNIQYHISKSLEQFLGLKILKFFIVDPGSGIFLTLDPGWKNSDWG
jgi:hypothetical protein